MEEKEGYSKIKIKAILVGKSQILLRYIQKGLWKWKESKSPLFLGIMELWKRMRLYKSS